MTARSTWRSTTSPRKIKNEAFPGGSRKESDACGCLDSRSSSSPDQSAIARGYFSLATLDLVHRRLEELLRQEGTSVDRFYVCPHGPDDECACRKPRPELAPAVRMNSGLICPSHSSSATRNRRTSSSGQAVGAGRSWSVPGTAESCLSSAAAVADYCVADLLDAAKLVEASWLLMRRTSQLPFGRPIPSRRAAISSSGRNIPHDDASDSPFRPGR